METELRRLQEMDFLRTKAVVIVANKIDLARSRSISTQGDMTSLLKQYLLLTLTQRPTMYALPAN
jgi:signal recognition particle receptor subunit beta